MEDELRFIECITPPGSILNAPHVLPYLIFMAGFNFAIPPDEKSKAYADQVACQGVRAASKRRQLQDQADKSRAKLLTTNAGSLDSGS